LDVELARTVIEALVLRSGIEKSIVDEVVLGQAKQHADAPNIARVAALKAGFPEEVPAYTVHRQCSSGLQAILNAVWQIQADYGDIIVAAGVESMSNAPYYLRNARYGYRSGNGTLVDPNTESQAQIPAGRDLWLLQYGHDSRKSGRKVRNHQERTGRIRLCQPRPCYCRSRCGTVHG